MPPNILEFLIVFIGAGLGGAMRHGVNIGSLRVTDSGYPYNTLFVNIVGCFVMGVLTEWFALRADPGMLWRLFLTTGILGGFTTFSTFSLDFALLVERGELVSAALYVLLSVACSLIGVFAGLAVVRHIA